MKTKKKYWLSGVTLAVIGVVLARVIARQFDQPNLQLILYALGAIIALAGIGVIMYGIRKGLKEK